MGVPDIVELLVAAILKVVITVMLLMSKGQAV